MEPTFIGLIFSCFNDAPDGVCRVEMTSFRTAADGTRIEVPVAVDAANVHSRSTLAALSAIPQIFFTEEETLFRQAQAVKHGEPLISVHNGAVYTAAVCRLLDQVCEHVLIACVACVGALIHGALTVREDCCCC